MLRSRAVPQIRFTETEKQILQYYLRGLAPKQVAEVVKCSVNTVYKAIYKYRRALREGIPKEELHRMIGVEAAGPASASPASAGPMTPLGTPQPAMPQPAYPPMILSPVFALPAQPQPLLDQSQLRELTSALREIASLLAEIRAELQALRASLPVRSASPPLKAEPPYEHEFAPSELPSYLRDNPWLEILASRPRLVSGP